MKLSIIITSWNTKNLLWSCLKSLEKYPPDYSQETIVVDNASHDYSAQMIEKEFHNVRLIKNSINVGYAEGNNNGFNVSTGEYILLLGSDTEVLPYTIQKMIGFLDSRKDVGAVACRLQSPDGKLQASCQRFPTIGNAVAMYLSLNIINKKYRLHDFDYSYEREVDQPDATCLMIRRKALNEKIFDERYSILYNDVDLCQRIKAKGWKIVFIPDATVIHHGSQSTRQAPAALRLRMYCNILLYYQTYFGFHARFILAPILAIRFLIITRKIIGLRILYSIEPAKL